MSSAAALEKKSERLLIGKHKRGIIKTLTN
jgi:hypothetical protein